MEWIFFPLIILQNSPTGEKISFILGFKKTGFKIYKER